MHRICGKRIPEGKKRGQRPQPDWRKNRCHGAEHSCISSVSLSPSRSLSLSLSRFFSSLCRSNGHGEDSEAGGIRARVSEGASLWGCFMGMLSISNCFLECTKEKRKNHIKTFLHYNHITPPKLPNNRISSTQPKPTTTYPQWKLRSFDNMVDFELVCKGTCKYCKKNWLSNFHIV